MLTSSPSPTTKLNDQHYYVVLHSNFSETGSYFTEQMSFGFSSDVLQLLSFDSVIHGGSWKQHESCLQTEAAAERHRAVLVFLPRWCFTKIAVLCNVVTLFRFSDCRPQTKVEKVTYCFFFFALMSQEWNVITRQNSSGYIWTCVTKLNHEKHSKMTFQP